jgi:diguanylate cyclase (GGDEF)-like protein
MVSCCGGDETANAVESSISAGDQQRFLGLSERRRTSFIWLNQGPGEASMQRAISGNEAQRLAALRRYDILDTAPEESFDRITRLAQTLLQTPMVLLSLIDEDRQWFKSRLGLDATETPRSISFCTHAIHQDAPLIVSDALEHPLFRDNPLVVGAPHIRFYIGVPLQTHDGHNIGTLLAADTRPRELSTAQVSALRDLARLAIDQIELRQIATIDSLTGALTRRGFEIEIAREMNRVHRYQSDFSLIAVDIEPIKVGNDRYGHAAGDLVLQTVGRLIIQDLRTVDFVGRVGDAEFVIALPETGFKGAQVVADRIRLKLAETAMPLAVRDAHVTASFGISSYDPADDTWETTLARANAALKEAKNNSPPVLIADNSNPVRHAVSG